MRRRAKASIVGLILLIGLAVGVTLAAATAPTVTTDDASAVSYTSARVTGTVNPEDQETFYRFEFATQADFSDAVSGAFQGPLAGDSGLANVEDTLTGLQPNTEYHLRLVADNVDGSTAVEATNTFTTLAVTAPVVTIEPVTTFDATSAQFRGSVDPFAGSDDPRDADPAFDSTWHFEYSTDETNWIALGEQGPVTGVVAQDVSDTATGLQPNKHYFVRLIAINLGGQTTSDAPNPDFTTEAAPPSVDTGPALSGGSSEARKLTGQVNPNNLPTTYWFEYGTSDCASSSCTSVPAGQDANAGSGGTAVSVERFINALDPDTTYHYRLVARNAEGTTEGSDLTFATPPAQGRPGDGFLPDDRAWELVSPVDKLGIDILSESSRTHASAGATATSPSAVSFAALGGFADVQAVGLASEYLTQRTGAPGTSGWTTHGITPPQEPLSFGGVAQGLEPYYDGVVAPDLSKGIFSAWSPLTDAPNVRQTLTNFYVRDDLRTAGTGSYRLITDAPTLLRLPMRY